MCLIKWFNKPTLCDRCERLISKVGREYKCPNGHTYVQYFTKAPSCCKNFKAREENDNA